MEYVNNKDFYIALKEYKAVYNEAQEKEEESPIMPDYLGECFLKIAKNLANRPNFSGYTFKEDMVGDAIENCLQYWNNFDPDKSSNPFAYFSQICWFAFVRRIKKEKRNFEINEELKTDEPFFDNNSITQPMDERTYDSHSIEEARREFRRARQENEKLDNFPDDLIHRRKDQSKI